MDDKLRREDLGAFLRARRERVSPKEAGIPNGKRRRTPGLRREEAAELAGVGVAWYTWLEQGRDIRVSAQALEGIARALRLTADERIHLFGLARQETPILPPMFSETVSPILQQILDHQTGPSYITNIRRDVLAWNSAACTVFGDYGALPPEDRNILRRIFLDPTQRVFHQHWAQDAQDILARFRADAIPYLDDPNFQTLIQELEASSPEFRAWWPLQNVERKGQGWKEFRHPTGGHLVMAYTALQVIAQPDLRMVVFTPLHGNENLID